MPNELVLLSEPEDQEFLDKFSQFLSHQFPLANVRTRDYSHPEGGGSGNLVFAKIYFPRSDYYTLLGVLRAEGNKVFILANSLIDGHEPVVQELGLEGVIFNWSSYGFYSIPSEPNKSSGFLFDGRHVSVPNLLRQKQYVSYCEVSKQSAASR